MCVWAREWERARACWWEARALKLGSTPMSPNSVHSGPDTDTGPRDTNRNTHDTCCSRRRSRSLSSSSFSAPLPLPPTPSASVPSSLALAARCPTGPDDGGACLRAAAARGVVVWLRSVLQSDSPASVLFVCPCVSFPRVHTRHANKVTMQHSLQPAGTTACRIKPRRRLPALRIPTIAAADTSVARIALLARSVALNPACHTAICATRAECQHRNSRHHPASCSPHTACATISTARIVARSRLSGVGARCDNRPNPHALRQQWWLHPAQIAPKSGCRGWDKDLGLSDCSPFRAPVVH